MPEELWIEARNIVQEAAAKTIPKKRKCKKGKWLSNAALQIAEKRRETKCKDGNQAFPVCYINVVNLTLPIV